MHSKKIIVAFAISAFAAAALTACGSADDVTPGGGSGTGGGSGGGTSAPVTPLRVVQPTITEFTASEGGTSGVAATGGVQPYTFELLESQTGDLTVNGDGTITVPPGMTPGTYRMRVRVRDAAEQEAVADFAITIVNLAEDPNQLSLEVTGGQNEVTFDGSRGGNVRIVATGGQPDYAWRINYTDFQPSETAVTFGADYVSGGETTGLIRVYPAVWGVSETISGKQYRRVLSPGACKYENNRGLEKDDALQSQTYKMIVAVKDAKGRQAVTPEIKVTVDCTK